MHYDLFNGDADGILSLHQLRLANPKDSHLVTGLKREVRLLERIKTGVDDSVTVLDISLDRNRTGLMRVLQSGARVVYFDHHYAGEIPESDCLTPYIDTHANICTGLLVDRHLDGAYRDWAVSAAFGDNLFASAHAAAKRLDLTSRQLEQLEMLGTLVNYNGYGETEDDLYFQPVDLYRLIQPHRNPFSFIEEECAFQVLLQGYQDDIEQVSQYKPYQKDARSIVYRLPDAAWARRVSGVWGNIIARQNPDFASVILREQAQGGLKVSMRAPLNQKRDADTICRQFEGGGGRAAAAGIGHLPEKDLGTFMHLIHSTYR
ncbi:MAG: hypothetical protein MJA28_03220 [Gammaproteobacteria bacterium]|nr:hypothetical protein [Gammaproteobacteria bacterium]